MLLEGAGSLVCCGGELLDEPPPEPPEPSDELVGADVGAAPPDPPDVPLDDFVGEDAVRVEEVAVAVRFAVAVVVREVEDAVCDLVFLTTLRVVRDDVVVDEVSCASCVGVAV